MKYPKVEIVVSEITTKEIVKALKRDLIDVGILALPINNVDLIEQPLYYEPFVLYVSPAHPLYKKEKVDLEDIEREDLLLLKEGHCLRDQTLKLCKNGERSIQGNDKKILFESGTIQTLLKLVEQDFGNTLLPYLAINEMTNQSLIRNFNTPVPKREIGLIFNKALIKRHMVNALADVIINSVPKELLETEESLIVR